MAIQDDFTVNGLTGDIRADTPAGNHTVIAFHRFLAGLADNPAYNGSTDDKLAMQHYTPSTRVTDGIIILEDHTSEGGPRWNIDDEVAKFLYGGSIEQGSGATGDLYSGAQVLGAVVSTGTQLMVIQDKQHYQYTNTITAPFWGDQTTPYNGSVTGAVLMRVLIKSRENGADINNGVIIVTAHNYGDTYSFFNVQLGDGESVAAISTVDDPQNDTAQGTVAAYTHVSNVEGFQQIDIADGNGNQPYYSKWSYTTDDESDGLKSVWEWGKNLAREGSALTIHGLDGEFFQGITHTYVYQSLAGGPFTEDETIVWGTAVTYTTLAGGTFTAGKYIRFSGGAIGRIMYDDGVDELVVALEDTSVTIGGSDTFIEYDRGSYGVAGTASGVTATVNTTVADNDKAGGSGILLANDTGGLKHHIQLLTGAAPVDTLEVRGLSSAATADVDTTITARTVNPVYLGSYVGSMIGGFGVGFAASDVSFPDTVQDLDGDTNTAPNNVTFTVSGLDTSAPDYLMLGEKHATNPDFDWVQSTITTTLDAANETAVVAAAIPDNTPASGYLRVTLDDGRRALVTYASFATLTYTLDTSITTGAFLLGADDTDNKFTRATGSFHTDGFHPGQNITTTLFTTGGNNSTWVIDHISEDGLELWVTGALAATEAGTGDEQIDVDGYNFLIGDIDDATSGNGVIVMPLDKYALNANESFTAVYLSPQTMFARVRFGGDGTGTDFPIKTFQGTSPMSSAGGSIPVSRLADY